MANTYRLIASSTVGAGGASSIDFTSIPATYTDVKLVLSTRDSNAVPTDNYLNINFNNDFGANYSNRLLTGNGGAASSQNFSAQTNGYIFQDNAAGATSSTFANIEVYIPNYVTSNAKSFSNDGVAESNVTTATGTRFLALNAGLWSGTAAINRITISPGNSANFVQYSTAYLYGISKS